MAGESLLIVDDDPFMQDLLTESLSQAGYDISVAETGERAQDLINRKLFHVALVDLSLPDQKGMQLTDYLATESPETEILIMTGYPSLETAIDALRGGVRDYIIKPFKVPEVHAAVHRALNNRQLHTEVQSLRQRVRDLEQEIQGLRSTTPARTAGRPTQLPGAYGAFGRPQGPGEGSNTGEPG